MPSTNTLIEREQKKRKKLHEDVKSVIDTVAKENREMTADEDKKLEEMNSKLEEYDSRIQNLEAVAQRENAEDEEDREVDDEGGDDNKNEAEDDEDGDGNEDERSGKKGKPKTGSIVILPDGRRARVLGTGSEAAKNRSREIRNGMFKQRPGESDAEFRNRKRRGSEGYRNAVRDYLRGDVSITRLRENRALQADLDIVGGYTVMPEQFVQQILKAADNYLYLRQLATIFKVQNAQTLGVPSWDTDPDDADWTSELQTGNEDSAARTGKRELRPVPLAKRIKISNRLVNISSVTGVMSVNDESQNGQGSGFENFVTGRLGYKFAVTMEKAGMTGTGVGQMLGLFTASTRGVTTSQDVNTGSTTGFTFDGLIEARYSLKAPYQERAQWLFSRPGLRRIRQLKDSYGQYLWQPSLTAGEPNRLLDSPIIMSEYVPSTFSSNAYVGMYADFSWYFIAESMNFEMRRLEELYAETNQIGYIARLEADGMPAMAEAFSRLKCAT
jgi:HK97 family phage major capsid protein